jgi:hypothetical protein
MPTPAFSPADRCFKFWHGAQKWEGRPSIRPCRAGGHEDGPGLYLTNDLDRAKRYARGAGCLVEMTLAADTRWLEAARLPVDELKAFVTGTAGLRRKERLLDDLDRASRREGPLVSVSCLVNLCVNHEALQGLHGPQLAQWLTEHGVDASHNRHGNESWIVVFNPAKIQRAQVHRVATVDPQASFPGWDEQREALMAFASPPPEANPVPAIAGDEADLPGGRRRRSP